MTLIVRRRFLTLMLSTALSSLLEARRSAYAGPSDQGIGGTGMAPPTEDTDRGIGGTGVIGTIRKFGSIVVNDMRIAYAPDATVRIDDAPASVADLKLGQVVRVVADGDPGTLSTRAIEITSEVVGPVERVSGKQITVLGQKVDTTALKPRHSFAVGDRVAVSGLRRNDGTIVASLIEPRGQGPDRVAGPVRVGDDGSLRIGDLRTAGVDPSLIDRRVHLEGTPRDGTFIVTRATSESSLLPASVSRLSVESYVERRNDGLVLGSGFVVSGSDGLAITSGRSVRAVVTTTVGPSGLSLVDVREGGRTFGPRGASGAGDPGRSGATRPMDFGHGPGAGGAGGAGPKGFGNGIGGGNGFGGGMPGMPGLGGGGLGGGLGGRR